MEPEVVEAEMVLPSHMWFKKIQMYEKYPKGQGRIRWKHLKQIIQAENYQHYQPGQPNYVNIETPPSSRPCKRICDITGYEAPYFDPRTKLRYANTDVFKLIRSLPNDYVQRYLALRNAAIILRYNMSYKDKSISNSVDDDIPPTANLEHLNSVLSRLLMIKGEEQERITRMEARMNTEASTSQAPKGPPPEGDRTIARHPVEPPEHVAERQEMFL